MSTNKSLDSFTQLHRCLAVMLKKNRFIRKLTHTNLTRAEIHALIEIDALKITSIKELQPILNIDQSSISRLIKSLINSGRVSATQDPNDKRSKKLQLTAKGQKNVRQIDEVAGKVFQSFIDRLTNKEAKEVLDFYKLIADWYDQPSCPLRTGENEVRMQQRRTSRAIGVLAKNIFKSELSSAQWNTFSEICNSTYPLNPKQLTQSQGIAANSLSIVLEKLEGLELIVRKTASHDSRYIELSPTAKGKNFLLKVEKQSAKDLALILSEYSERQLKSLILTMNKYLDIKEINSSSKLNDDYSVNKVTKSKVLNKLRCHLITEIVHSGEAQYVPPTLLADISLVYALNDKSGNFIGACELLQKGSLIELNILTTNKGTPPATTLAFLTTVIQSLKKQLNTKSILISYPPAQILLKNAGVSLKNKVLLLA